MKKKYWILCFFTTCTFISAIAQTINIEDIMSNLKSGNIVKAKEISDKSVNDVNLSKSPKTWFYRAITYHAIYENPAPEIKAIDKQSLNVAYTSYIKTLQLDQKKDYNTEVVKALRIVSSQFVYEGIQTFNNKDYNNALNCFESTLAINRLPEINQLDTIIIYNAALSAEKADKIPLAIEYYNQLIKLSFSGSKMYLDQAVLFKKIGKEQDYLKTIQEGMRNYPNSDINLISELVNFYLEKGNNDEAMNYVEKGLMREPKNPAFHFIKGSLLDQKGDIISAEKEYKSTLEFDPEHTDALFNLGALYYNQATDIIKKATNKDEQNKAFEIYKKAIPYLEKISLQTPADTQILKMLKTIYTLLKDDQKLQEINKKLEKTPE